MTMQRLGALVLVFGLAACADIPRDPNQTADRVLQSQKLDVGVVSGSDSDESRIIIDRLESLTGAKATIAEGEASLLVDRLEQGRLDLLIGSFAKNSPLKTSVTFSVPVGNRKVPANKPVIRAAMHPGENRWIMLVEKAVRRP